MTSLGEVNISRPERIAKLPVLFDWCAANSGPEISPTTFSFSFNEKEMKTVKKEVLKCRLFYICRYIVKALDKSILKQLEASPFCWQ